MSDSPELAALSRAICGPIDRLVACLDGLSDDQARWRPPVPEANSLLILVQHTLGSTEKGILERICGQPVGRDRPQEFVDADRSAAAVMAHWQALRPKLETALAGLEPSVLEETRVRPGHGTYTVRGLLLLGVWHAALHLGHAELTRDWILAQGSTA